jgi:phenylacetic acid degradation operon negative regulatory protein
MPPRALILSVFGAFIRRVGGWMPVAGLIELMASLGVDEQAVRSAVSRLKRRGVLVSERRDGVAGYRLSEEGMRILTEGDRRIYGRPRRTTLADGWALATFSVPDAERATRHVLRSQLSWLGFANLSPGLWLAPSHVADEARGTLERRGLAKYVHLFHARYLAFRDPAAVVRACWDLDRLAAAYRDYADAYEPVLRKWRDGRSLDGLAAFRDHIETLTAWRRLPFLDPGLPAEALPPDWPGGRAWSVFHDLVELVDAPSFRHVRRIVAAPQPEQRPRPVRSS